MLKIKKITIYSLIFIFLNMKEYANYWFPSANNSLSCAKCTCQCVVFQSQLFGFSFLNNYLNNTISTFFSIFSFTNNNWAVAGRYSNWFLIQKQEMNFTMKFDDTEGDTVLLKLIDSGNINLFIQQLNKSTYTLIAAWYDDTVSESSIVLAYTDVYSKRLIESKQIFQILTKISLIKLIFRFILLFTFIN